MPRADMETRICVVGLGYVGLPLACVLSEHYPVIGFDVDEKKIDELQHGIDRTGEVGNLSKCSINYTSSASAISQANFIIVAVPTPITDAYQPDLTLVEKATETVGKHLAAGSIVVYESTVYPGCTEEVCVPILERHSGLKCGKDFFVGYSPERVNPGDREHGISNVVKVVSGMDQVRLDWVAATYGSVTKVHRAPSIKVAEAAKVIENVQRDLNIALMNELAMIFSKLGIDTKAVLAAAGTKWNFHPYTPGLVGGHCIGVDPYYLAYKAQQVGHEPKVILAGRAVNESMAGFVADKLAGRKRVLIMGVTFKEDVPDIRNSKAKPVAEVLIANGATVDWYDPVVIGEKDVFGQRITALPTEPTYDAILVFSPHRQFSELSLDQLRAACSEQPLLFDIKGFYPRLGATAAGFTYLTL